MSESNVCTSLSVGFSSKNLYERRDIGGITIGLMNTAPLATASSGAGPS